MNYARFSTSERGGIGNRTGDAHGRNCVATGSNGDSRAISSIAGDSSETASESVAANAAEVTR